MACGPERRYLVRREQDRNRREKVSGEASE